MKKFITGFIIIIVIAGGFLLHNVSKKKNDDNDKLTKVTLAEVAHSIFYAPQYVAISEGFFEEEGILIDLTLTSGADAVMAAVLSGDVDVGFCGTEATIYVVAKRKKKIPFLVLFRNKEDNC